MTPLQQQYTKRLCQQHLGDLDDLGTIARALWTGLELGEVDELAGVALMAVKRKTQEDRVAREEHNRKHGLA